MTESLAWDSHVRFLKGVGPARASRLGRLGVDTVEDLLYFFPRRYEDRRSIIDLSRLEVGSVSHAIASVVSIERRPTRKKNLSIVNALLSDGSSMAQAVWFNRKGLERVLIPGTRASFYGRVESRGGVVQIVNPEFEILEDKDADTPGLFAGIVPVYPGTEGLFHRWVRSLVFNAVETFAANLPDPLPPEIREKNRLVSIEEAVRSMHFPEGRESWSAARKRLAFDELFLLQTALALRKRSYEEETGGYPLSWDGPILQKFRKEILPFELTSEQEKVLGEITRDSRRNAPMNRLLQGDVGSGKTVVALMFLLAAVDSGFQGAIMAPTEVLARQHHRKISNWLSGTGVEVLYLSGSMTSSQKTEALAHVMSGRPGIAVGTHALIQKGVRFGRLGAVVVDEQHRFGVLQRSALAEKGQCPHVLVMTATPIPRTLTLSVYGDLSFSTIEELPPGRTPPVTKQISNAGDPRLIRFMEEEISGGGAIYWVCPVIEENGSLPLTPVIGRHRILSEIFGQERVGILHGQVPSGERERIMDLFSTGKLSVLVSTTVVEVGLDVPEATVMIIEDAHRFGLSQLHQLRGRVGRSSRRSYCFLVGNPKTPEGIARLKAMCSTADGFRIAEADLSLRGPGELCGIRQHGVTDFKVADLSRDRVLLDVCREDAINLVSKDPLLDGYPVLRKEVFRKLGRKLKLVETA
ncbi:MAG TPA: ATP-dependent DNA helicase RecG [Thermovirgaceae bacterium]|jgi:ATP-dependent DNA helicase RecG|nr:ATP-dependent DNA helicase RecG [Thermovirgaceae bacterium]